MGTYGPIYLRKIEEDKLRLKKNVYISVARENFI